MKSKKTVIKLLSSILCLVLLLTGVGIIPNEDTIFNPVEVSAASTGLSFCDGYYKTDNMKLYAYKDGSARIHLSGGSSLVEYYTGAYTYNYVELQARSYDSSKKTWSSWEAIYFSGQKKSGVYEWVSEELDGIYDIGKNDSKIELKVIVRGYTGAYKTGCSSTITNVISFDISRRYGIFGKYFSPCESITLSGYTYSGLGTGIKTLHIYTDMVK